MKLKKIVTKTETSKAYDCNSGKIKLMESRTLVYKQRNNPVLSGEFWGRNLPEKKQIYSKSFDKGRRNRRRVFKELKEEYDLVKVGR